MCQSLHTIFLSLNPESQWKHAQVSLIEIERLCEAVLLVLEKAQSDLWNDWRHMIKTNWDNSNLFLISRII